MSPRSYRSDKIDYIVVNHIEPDHNSGLRLVMEAIPQAKVVASAAGVRGIAEYHGAGSRGFCCWR